MFAKPQSEHVWLEQLVGKWAVNSECQMGPEAPPQKATGSLTCRTLGGLWLIGEGEGKSPDDEETWSSIMTIGYDPSKGRFIGTFIASMMTHLWPYSGVLDASGKRLPLDSEGPKFEGEGMAKYRDTIEIIDRNHWKFSGEMMLDNGTWQTIMTSDNRRA